MKRETTAHYNYLIIGGGPAGLQLAYYLEQAGREYLVLEAAARPGAFFERFPRHRQLISINKVSTGYDDNEINLRWDWNSLLSDDGPWLKEYSDEYLPSPDALVEYLGSFTRQHQLKIACDCKVVKIDRPDVFTVETADGLLFSADRLIVATGLFRPYIPPIPGIELAEQYVETSVDPKDFKGQRVLVLGKGNSGFETADNLISTTALVHVLSPTPLRMAWKTHYVGHLRAVNNNFLDTYQLKSQNALLDATIERIERRGNGFAVSVDYSHAQGEREELFYDRIICCTGFRFDDSIFADSARPDLALEDRFPAQTPAWESVNVPDLFFAGTLMQARGYKKSTSGFIHGFRYNIRALHHLFEERYAGRPLPCRQIEASPEGLVDAMLARVNRSSGLWQQFGFLGDFITRSPESGDLFYYEELPLDYVPHSDLGAGEHWSITLEFGKVEGDPFNIQRQPDPALAAESAFLHPVIRHYSGSRQLSEHHLLENLYGEWLDPVLHHQPLVNYATEAWGEALVSVPTPAGAREATGELV